MTSEPTTIELMTEARELCERLNRLCCETADLIKRAAETQRRARVIAQVSASRDVRSAREPSRERRAPSP